VSNDAQAIIDTAVASADPSILNPGDIVSVVVPSEGRQVTLDLDQYSLTPRRKRGKVRLFTAESLADYVNVQKLDGTALYADVDNVTIVGVINGHNSEATDMNAPGWGDHRTTFQARLTPEWLAWSAMDGKMVKQAQFAEFLEDRVDDIVSPPAADLLELAKTFEATSRADFKSSVRLDSGQRQLTYVETIDAKAGQTGQLLVPEMIELGITPFEGADTYRLAQHPVRTVENEAESEVTGGARFRYRLGDAFDAVLATVETTTELKAYRGLPPE